MDSSKIKQTIQNLTLEMDKFDNKMTKVSATKIRKLLSELTKDCKVLRGNILTTVKNIPKKTRVKKVVEQEQEKNQEETW